MAFQSKGKTISVACLRRAISLTASQKNCRGNNSARRTAGAVAAWDILEDHAVRLQHSAAAAAQHVTVQQQKLSPHNSLPSEGSTSTSTASLNSGASASSNKDDNTKSNSPPPPPPPPSIPIDKLLLDIEKAAEYNQGNTRKVLSKRRARRNYFWDYTFCRETAEAYEQYLLSMAKQPKTSLSESQQQQQQQQILSPEVVDKALVVLLRSRHKPNKLSVKVREWERALGTLWSSATPLTDQLSLRLLEANGKAGNMGRVLSLLEYRTSQHYQATRREFVLAITGVEAAGWYLRQNRNIFLGDLDQPVIDNPTRWLDAILINMRAREFPLTTDLATRMMSTFASRGRTGKAVHYFYSVHRTPIISSAYGDEDDDDGDGDDHDNVDGYQSDEEDHLEDSNVKKGDNAHDEDLKSAREGASDKPRPRSYQVRIKLKTPPPYYKVPTDVKGKLLPVPSKKTQHKNDGRTTGKTPQQQKQQGVLKIDREREPDWSPPLTAAFSFADSLTHGACGHEPIQLNLVCYNILIQTCVYRGALWRAMHLLDTVMPSQAGITPDHRSYDILLAGLARVGDVTLMRDYYQRMISKGIKPSYYTVHCIVDGLLNLGDVAGAVTVVQDFFNQHSVLPPVETQLKIFEFALGLEMPYEAKRHVYFIQQIWKWQPHYKYDSKEFIYYMKTYQRDPRISKEALQHLFRYFGEELDEEDFF